ncbi:hypothetical protein BRC63_05645 [Halobacteriales archaeon QH_10_70_21]|nr:MAG: hypothetical protein BRC63_05645 [Halobacteriales archaeon QH_10_70_21]
MARYARSGVPARRHHGPPHGRRRRRRVHRPVAQRPRRQTLAATDPTADRRGDCRRARGPRGDRRLRAAAHRL